MANKKNNPKRKAVSASEQAQNREWRQMFQAAGLRLTKYTMRKLGPATDVDAWFAKAREKPADAPVWTPQRQRV